LDRVTLLARSGALRLPNNYSPANALKLAWLMLMQTVNAQEQPVLDNCSRVSIANALLEMCIQGLNPMKKQCYFIAYGNQLTMQRSYQGSMAVAKRCAPVLSIHAQVIYEMDIFEYSVDVTTGRKKVTKHDQKMENIDLNKIKGAYAIAVFEDETTDMEVMNITQIRKAWQQGKGGGNTGAHQNFTDEMCKKTVIGRVCKTIINNSNDADLFANGDEHQLPENANATVIEEIKSNSNIEELNLDEVPQEVAVPAVESAKPTPAAAATASATLFPESGKEKGAPF
jgi:recombination protein RecT